ncbi:conserved hypothetical protein [uncultured delta proteobacterium]|uniref:Asparagine synthetase domain-containing protein n=1 Tax=uncultured delta proteobacterium TaxID=34034 RepID=A0A212K0D1_9DELT|nr:conserved hypothetical protein [uncultured delta proteobacterium]
MPDAQGAARREAVLDGILRATAALSGDVPGIAVAYSGGLDSRFLIHMARRAGLDVTALHIRGPHIPAREHGYAVQWAADRGVPLTVIERDPLGLPELKNNPKDRCYHCKRIIFTALREAAGGLPLCDGTNASDMDEYRPGLRALRELGVRSPLAEAGIGKRDIRAIAAATGMEDPDQAAQPCLLTRFGYGAELTPGRLAAVDAAEEAVRRVFAARGLDNEPFRVRYEDARTAALHVTRGDLPPEVLAALADALAGAGFSGAPVRVMDSLSGYFDRV